MLDFGALHEESPAEEHDACTNTVVQGVPASSSAWLDATEDQLARRAGMRSQGSYHSPRRAREAEDKQLEFSTRLQAEARKRKRRFCLITLSLACTFLRFA